MEKISRKLIQCVQSGNKDVTFEQTILAIKNAGFDGVFIQWYNKNWAFSQQRQAEFCRNLGLDIEFAHLGYDGINDIWAEGQNGDLLVEGYLRDLDEIRRNNIPMVVMHLTSKFVAPPPCKKGIERLQKIADYAEQLNVKIAIENTKIWGYLEYVFERITNPNVGLCFDSGHCHCRFDGKFSWETFKDKIFAVHLHDNDKSDDLHLLPYDGTIDWDRLCQKLNEAHYKGAVTLETTYRNQYLQRGVEQFYSDSFKIAQKLRNKLN